jgi:hypothetical protein
VRDNLRTLYAATEQISAEVTEVARRTAARIAKVLCQHGRELDPEFGVVDVASDTEDVIHRRC